VPDQQPKPLPSPATPLDQRLAKLASLFPEAVRDGELDPEVLAQFIDPDRADGDRFGLMWPGRGHAIRALRAKPAGALHPVGEQKSGGGHDLIAADNLEALKLLRTAYAGRIRACFIDPPYNTGRDFVYQDDFADPLAAYLLATGQVTEDGNRVDTDTDTRGRRHSAWLTMMYPRLVLAHDLLAEDGVLFVTIDSVEVAHLRVLLDEVFTEDAFVASVSWQRRAGAPNDKVLGPVHDTLLVYAKCPPNPRTPEESSLYRLGDLARIRAKYTNPDNHPLGDYVTGDLSANGKGDRYVAHLDYAIANPNTGIEYWPSGGRCWRMNAEDAATAIAEKRIDFGPDGQGGPRLRRFWSERVDGVSVPDVWTDLGPAMRKELGALVTEMSKDAQARAEAALPADASKATKTAVRRAVRDSVKLTDELFATTRLGDPWHHAGSNKAASSQLKRILGEAVDEDTDEDVEGDTEETSNGSPFQTAKPLQLLELCVKMATRADEGHVVLDFFAGSGTTAAAVMRVNAADGGNRQSISIQLPESSDHPDYTDLFEVMVARVRAEARAVGTADPVRTWRYGPPAITPWDSPPSPSTGEDALNLFEASADRVAAEAELADVTWEVALALGIPLDAHVERRDPAGVPVDVISDPRSPLRVFVTLGDELAGDLPHKLGCSSSDYLVCRDAALSDTAKANISLHCRVRTL
jgi:hypothetical protein